MPEERRALEALADYHHGRDGDRVAVALAALVGHPRVLVEGELGRPVAVRRGTLRLAVEETDGGARLSAAIGSHPIGAAHLAGEGDLIAALDREHATCWVAEASPRVRGLLRAITVGAGARLPVEALPALLERLPALEQVVEVTLPERLAGERVDADLCPVAQVRALAGDTLALRVCAKPHGEGATYAPGEGPARVSGLRAGVRALAVRDLPAERERAQVVRHTLAEGGGTGRAWQLETTDLESTLDCVAALRRLSDDGLARVEWEGERLALSRPGRPSDLSMRLGARKDWFGLDGAPGSAPPRASARRRPRPAPGRGACA